MRCWVSGAERFVERDADAAGDFVERFSIWYGCPADGKSHGVFAFEGGELAACAVGVFGVVVVVTYAQ